MKIYLIPVLVAISLASGCARFREVEIKSLLKSTEKDIVLEHTSEEGEIKEFGVRVESESLTVEEILSELPIKIYIPSEDVRSRIVTGEFRSSRMLIDAIQAQTNTVLLDRDGLLVLVDKSEHYEHIVWSWSGGETEDLKEVLQTMGIDRVAVVDERTVCIAVEAQQVADVRAVLRLLDERPQWLAEVIIVDRWSVGIFRGIGQSSSEIGGEVDKGKIVDRFLLPVREGAERVQKFGRKIPVQTSHVTETGVLVSGNVDYQDVSSEIGVTISTTTNGSVARVRVVISEPDDVIADGLVSVSFEEVDSVVEIGEAPVLVSRMARWKKTGGIDSLLGEISRLGASGGLETRRYEIYVHAVQI